MTYSPPDLSILVLDYCKPWESRECLESIKRHIKIPHHVIFCDNGSGEDYPAQFVREGLVDQLIVNRDSTGLGLGTRDLFAASFSLYSIYLQNDQVIARDFGPEEFAYLKKLFMMKASDGRYIMSVSLAGSPCGAGVYSERCHLVLTNQYKQWEANGILGYHGAGPYHDGIWREAQIQAMYAECGMTHWEHHHVLVRDNGVFAVRDMKEGGVWCHRTDTKALWCIVQPKDLNAVYPKFTTPGEFGLVTTGGWPDGQIPQSEIKDSFDCWSQTELGRRQDEYIADLRRRFKEKG